MCVQGSAKQLGTNNGMKVPRKKPEHLHWSVSNSAVILEPNPWFLEDEGIGLRPWFAQKPLAIKPNQTDHYSQEGKWTSLKSNQTEPNRFKPKVAHTTVQCSACYGTIIKYKVFLLLLLLRTCTFSASIWIESASRLLPQIKPRPSLLCNLDLNQGA